MLPYLTTQFGNASSQHRFGYAARRAVERAREQVAAAVGANPAQVIFTSGGSESNNLFIKGVAGTKTPSQIVISAVEHPCVARPAKELTRHGWVLTQLDVNNYGQVQVTDLAQALQQPTGLISVMLVNNETGVQQDDLAALAELARVARVPMHTDAVQALGKCPLSFPQLGLTAMTLSAHKIYGPKGAGALVVDKRLSLRPLIQGGGHEAGLRAGTENVAAIVGFGLACELAVARLTAEHQRLIDLRDFLEHGVLALGGSLFGAGATRIANTSYFAFDGIDGDTLAAELDEAGFAVSSGAACSSGSPEPSKVLLAMGVPADLARGAIRVSMGRSTSDEDIAGLLQALAAAVKKLRQFIAVMQ